MVDRMNKPTEEDDGGNFWSDVLLQKLIYQTALVLKNPLETDHSRNLFQFLETPLPDGPHALQFTALKEAVREKLDSARVSESLLCGSFLLFLHYPLMEAVQAGWFNHRTSISDAMLASHLMLHKPHIWDSAIQLAPYCCRDSEEARIVQGRLRILNGHFNGGYHLGPKAGNSEATQEDLEPVQAEESPVRVSNVSN
ncbi:MAG: hypothetical protein HY731_03980 [Candidatus Tectomicrobia bacterium]|nr:hypothetical protein [Candidatus Tectomicrobia bacterium]